MGNEWRTGMEIGAERLTNPTRCLTVLVLISYIFISWPGVLTASSRRLTGYMGAPSRLYAFSPNHQLHKPTPRPDLICELLTQESGQTEDFTTKEHVPNRRFRLLILVQWNQRRQL